DSLKRAEVRSMFRPRVPRSALPVTSAKLEPATIVLQRGKLGRQSDRSGSHPWWWRLGVRCVRGTMALVRAAAAPLVWFSKSVRRLIVLMVVIAAALACVSHSARAQRYAVAAIESAGGRLWYDWEWADGGPTGGMPVWPE